MYKGLVLKIKKHYALVLTKENDYKKIAIKDGLFVGQKILFLEEDIIKSEVNKSVNIMRNKVIAFATTAAMVLIMIFGSNMMPVSTYALISIDINPSLDIRIDKDQNVIEIIPLNDDANDIYNDDMIDSNIFDVIDELILNAETLNYLTEENNHILISSANLNDKGNEALSDLITSHLENDLELHTNVQIIYVESDKETAKESLNKGVSLGRLEIANITNDDVKDDNVTDIANKDKVKEKATHVKIKDIGDIEELNGLIDKLNLIEDPSTDILTFLDSLDNLEEQDLNKLIKDAQKILDDDNALINLINDLVEELRALDTEDEEIIIFLDSIDQLILDSQNNNNELAVLKNQAKDHLLRIQKQDNEENNNGKNDIVKLIKYLNELEAYRDKPEIGIFIDTIRETIKTDLSDIDEFIEDAEGFLKGFEDTNSNTNGSSNQNNKSNPNKPGKPDFEQKDFDDDDDDDEDDDNNDDEDNENND